jgi:hypothetical protein
MNIKRPTKKLMLEIISKQGARKIYQGPHYEDRESIIGYKRPNNSRLTNTIHWIAVLVPTETP